MTGDVPHGYVPQPDSGYVEQVNPIEDGLHAYTEPTDIRDRISQEIGRVAVQGTTQSR